MKSFAILSAFVASALAVVLPSEDPFYTETPADLASYAPGAVIKVREVPPNINGLIPGGPKVSVDKVYQYYYRSTNAIGEPAGAVTTLLKPFNANPMKLLAYQTAYDSANNNCSPSYALQAGANTTAVADVIMISAALNQGWYVVSPDFEGLNAAFTVGTQSGYHTLDSVRAALSEGSRTAGLSPSARYAMWGYSGGAIGSEWAAELQAQYAPELKFQGVALGGMTPNVSSVLFTINRGPFSGLAFSGIYGFIKAFPNLTEYANEHLVPAKRDEFFGIANGCLGQTALGGGFKDLFTYADNGVGLVSDELPKSVIAAAGQMGNRGTPGFPMYIYKAIGDEISKVEDTTFIYNKLCSQGSVIEYRKNLVGEHVTEAILGSAGAIAWISDRLDGKPVSIKKCTTKLVAVSSLDLGAGLGALAEFATILKILLGGKLGHQVSG